LNTSNQYDSIIRFFNIILVFSYEKSDRFNKLAVTRFLKKVFSGYCSYLQKKRFFSKLFLPENDSLFQKCKVNKKGYLSPGGKDYLVI